MINYVALAVALLLSAVAAYYSIIGLTVIFAAAFIPIVVMGCSLELAKVVATSWVYRNWHTAPSVIKYYLITAIAVLMIITSLGTFGFLSKAHVDSALPSGDLSAKLAIYDEKIKTAKDSIDANRRALKQMDEAVDQVMVRSTTETGAERSVQLRRQQGPERKRLITEIEAEQKKIGVLNEERAPVAAEVRKIEAEVGPLSYVAELFYGSSEPTVVEKAIRLIIILIVIVFDPLAIILLIAANHGIYGSKEKSEDISWLQRVKDLKLKRDPSKIEVDSNSILKL